MGELNVGNRTLAIMDNLPFLRSLNNECIDLIAIDPPFAANETFTGNPKPPISDAEYAEEIALAQTHGPQHNEGQGETRVHDIWSWDEDVHPAWKMMIEDDYPSVHAVIQAVEACASENEAAYIAFMAVRLIECRRVLKPTGSIYLHCDRPRQRLSADADGRDVSELTTTATRSCGSVVMGRSAPFTNPINSEQQRILSYSTQRQDKRHFIPSTALTIHNIGSTSRKRSAMLMRTADVIGLQIWPIRPCVQT